MGQLLDRAMEHDGLVMNETVLLFAGSSTPEVDEPDAPVGSVYFRSNGDRYVRTANTGSGVAEDWELEPFVAGGGPTVQLDWEFDAATGASDPGSGNFRYNNSTPAACSENSAKLTPEPSQVAPRGYELPGQTFMFKHLD